MNFTPIKLTIVDFLGVFIPGSVWVVLFWTFSHLITANSNPNSCPNPLNTAIEFLSLSDAKYGFKLYLVLGLAAIILGYLNMSLSTQWTDFLARPYLWNLKDKNKYKDAVFPYNEEFLDKPYLDDIFYYLSIQLNTKNNLNIEYFRDKILDLPTYQPFETCKKILKLHAPTLWEEVQYREAQVRLLSSLFLASIFNFLLSVSYFVFIGTCPDMIRNFLILILSLLIMVYLATVFRLRRLREVQDVYLCTFIVLRDQSYNSNQKSQ